MTSVLVKSPFLLITVHGLCVAFEDKLELDINIFFFAFPLLSHLSSQNIDLRLQILETVESTCVFGNKAY